MQPSTSAPHELLIPCAKPLAPHGAGGRASYMSLMGFANSLMLDFRCWVVPRFVYAVRTELPDGGSPQKAIVDRIEQLASASWRAGEALHPAVG